MRGLWAMTILVVLPGIGFAQNLELKVEPRYGVMINTRTFTQRTPQDALASTIRAIEENRFDVLVAHIISEKVTEAMADEKARLLENEAEDHLRGVREKQKANPLGVLPEEKLPYEPKAFAEFVKVEAKNRGFKATIEDVRKKFAADLNIVKVMKRYLRDGEFIETGDTAKVVLKDAKGKGIFFVKVKDRWFVEDRQEEAAKGGMN
ncbi:MAG: hypothetical protein JNK93_14350 [Planctomycetia bacterium]|nr:hypothetical protein [Planctomycetia bacterium]